LIDSFSLHRRQVLSLTVLLFAILSRVKSLFLDTSHKKNCTLGGIGNFQIELTNTGEIPLKLTTAYKDCTEYFPEELYAQII